MGASISLRDDFDGASLRRLARTSKSANQARRLLALAEIYDGGRRTSAVLGCRLYVTGCFALMPVVPMGCSMARRLEDSHCSMMPSAVHLSKWSSAARSRRSMVLFAGG